MSEELLRIGAGTTVRVLVHEEAILEVEASYAGGGSAPPAHLHPGQDERFEVLSGAMRTRIDGSEGELRAGERLEISAGTVHQMWNAASAPAALRWVTTPSGRTLKWYRELAATLAGAPLGDPATLLDRYSDVFRLAEA